MVETRSNKKVFKVLAIDGGGMKGLYSATILKYFEEKFNNKKTGDYFDLICGTSTGGIIALALSQGFSAKEISDFYLELGPKVFNKRKRIGGLAKQTILRGKYSQKALKKILVDKFEEKKIEDSNNLLCIPSFSVTDWRPYIFKFDHKEGKLDRDNKRTCVDVALATAAAPTYFPIHELSNGIYEQLIDGGIWANNPTLVGLLEAVSYFVGENKEFDELHILSLSSLYRTGGFKPSSRKRRSFIHWRYDLFDTSMTSQSYFTEYFMSKIKDSLNLKLKYIRIPSNQISSDQEKYIQMDNASKKTVDLLISKGQSIATIYVKKKEIEEFYHHKKNYKTQI